MRDVTGYAKGCTRGAEREILTGNVQDTAHEALAGASKTARTILARCAENSKCKALAGSARDGGRSLREAALAKVARNAKTSMRETLAGR